MEKYIEMSDQIDWKNTFSNKKIENLSQIQKPIRQTIYRILRERPPGYKQKKKKIKNVSVLYINPLSFWIGIWNFIIIFVAYFLCLQISLTIGFGPQFWNNQIEQTIYWFAYVCLLFMLVADMFINFFKGYYAFGYGKVIDDQTLIALRYLKSYFAPDLICLAILVIPIFKSNYILNFLQLVAIVLLFVKKFKCQAEIAQSLTYHKVLRIAFILGILVCDYMLLGNFGACIFLGMDLLLWRLQFFGNNPQYYWLSNNTSYSVDLMSGPWIAQYIYAQQYSTGTLSTLAPGPFGKNPIEITFQLFLMTFFMILASYVGEVLIQILYGGFVVRIFHENNIQKFDSFMSLKKVTSKIKTKIHNFFQLIWQFQIKNNAQGQQKIIQKMPLSLQEDLVTQLGFTQQLKFTQFFKDFDDFQKLLAFKIKQNIVSPDSTIFEQGPLLESKEERHIIFVKNGLAKYFFSFGQNLNIISLSNTQKLIGQYQFISGLSYPFSCKSVDLSVLQKISFSDIMNIIKNFGLIQQFFMLRQRVTLTNQLYLINQFCMVCDKQHREDQCPQLFIHYQIKQQAKFQNNLYKKLCQYQYRTQYQRKLDKKIKYSSHNSWLNHLDQEKMDRYNKKIKRLQQKLLKQLQQTELNNQSDVVTSYNQYFYNFNMFS